MVKYLNNNVLKYKMNNLINVNNFECLIEYITSNTNTEIDKNYRDKIIDFEKNYNLFFYKKKFAYYNQTVMLNSLKHNSLPNWIINILMDIDLIDSINKFLFSNIIQLHKKKCQLRFLKNTDFENKC